MLFLVSVGAESQAPTSDTQCTSRTQKTQLQKLKNLRNWGYVMNFDSLRANNERTRSTTPWFFPAINWGVNRRSFRRFFSFFGDREHTEKIENTKTTWTRTQEGALFGTIFSFRSLQPSIRTIPVPTSKFLDLYFRSYNYLNIQISHFNNSETSGRPILFYFIFCCALALSIKILNFIIFGPGTTILQEFYWEIPEILVFPQLLCGLSCFIVNSYMTV